MTSNRNAVEQKARACAEISEAGPRPPQRRMDDYPADPQTDGHVAAVKVLVKSRRGMNIPRLTSSGIESQCRNRRKDFSAWQQSWIASAAPWLWLTFVLGLALSCNAAVPPTSESGQEVVTERSYSRFSLWEPTLRRNWSVQTSVAVISKSNIDDIFRKGYEPAEGDASGLLYSLTLNWTAHRFEIPFRQGALRPQFEPYFRLTLVDEKGSSLFPDYNGGVGFRWVDFPWNRWVDTTLFTGIGFSYSSQVYRVDRERHPGKERSHWKFDWPIEFTLAIPRWRQHQILFFVDHQSGGHIFDQGGVNSYGIGYRFEF